MDKRVILFSVLLLGWTWTLQGVPVDQVESTAEPADIEVPTVNTAPHNTTVFNATEVCIKAPETGRCLAYIERYFYNSTSTSCEVFIYGGCGGNQNNFKDETECIEKCFPEDEEEVIEGSGFYPASLLGPF